MVYSKNKPGLPQVDLALFLLIFFAIPKSAILTLSWRVLGSSLHKIFSGLRSFILCLLREREREREGEKVKLKFVQKLSLSFSLSH